MSRSRRPPYVRWKVNLDATLAAQIELHFFDPTHGKPRYGDRSELIEALLREWLSKISPPLPQIGSNPSRNDPRESESGRGLSEQPPTDHSLPSRGEL